MDKTYFYKDKPIFGLDIGYNSLKVMQIRGASGKNKMLVSGYGVTSFDPAYIQGGVIVEPEKLAKVTKELFDNSIVGKITTRRVAATIPAARTFNRAMILPKLSKKDMDGAVKLEAEQYIPVPLDDLYLDYDISVQNEKETHLLAVAAPRKVIESYMTYLRILGLEVAALETTIASAGRLVAQAEQSTTPTVLIDLGSLSTDITIYDNGLVVTGTVPGGGDIFTQSIADKLKVTLSEAHTIKTKYGLGVSKKQKEITDSLDISLVQLSKEIKRMVRYYEERAGEGARIGQVVTMGGGANMPGLSDYLTSMLRLPVRMCSPWENITFGHLPPPNSVEKSMYITVAGLALIKPKDIFV